MDKNERIDKLQKASAEINSAIRNIRLALKDTRRESYAENYIIGHLDTWANSDYGLDITIPKLIQEIEKEE